MIKSSFEKDVVSAFRKHVRSYRFNQPKVEKQLLDVLDRMDLQDKPNIAVFRAQSLVSTRTSSTIDSTGAGKTDFTYYATEYYRQKNAFVLPFPNTADRITADTNFFETEFIPEIYKCTSSPKDKIIAVSHKVLAIIIMIFQRFVLLIRASLWLAIAFMVFVLGSGFVALRYLVETYGSTVEPYVELITPLTFLIMSVIWILLAWDRIKSDDKRYSEWQSHSTKAMQEILRDQMLKTMASSNILKRFPKNQKGVIIIDDVEKLNSNSLSSLVKFVENLFSEKSKVKYFSHIALVMVIEEAKITRKGMESDLFENYFDEVLIKNREWLHYDLPSTSIDDVQLLLWGYYDSDISEQAWTLVNALLRVHSELRSNIGFLLQFLYNQTRILENENLLLTSVTENDFIQNYEKFRKSYNLHANDILARISDDNLELACKTMMKLILAFQPLRADKEVIDTVLRAEELDSNTTFHRLVESGLVKTGEGSYYFTNPLEMNALDLTWDEWIEDSESYRTKIFLMIHDVFPVKKKDPPLLAKKCYPSNLIIDCLWREADALWFYGGEADTISTLAFSGLDDGALGKWYRKLHMDASNSDISDLNFEWISTAKNAPFKTSSSQSIRSTNFIGELIKFVASLYFIAGDFEKAHCVLEEVWNNALKHALASSNVTNRIRQKLIKLNPEIQIQRAEFWLRGPLSIRSWENAEKICSEIIRDEADSNVTEKAKIFLLRINFFRKYGPGNSLYPLSLIREPISLPISSNKELSDRGTNLLTLNIQLFALFEFLEWSFRTNKDFGSEISVIRSLLKDYRLQYNKLKQFSETRPISLKDPDLDIKLLTFWGWYEAFIANLIEYEYRRFALNYQEIPNQVEQCGIYMLKHSNYAKELVEEFNPSRFDINNRLTSHQLSLTADVNQIYGQYLNAKITKPKEAKELCQQITQRLKECTHELQNFYRENALDTLILARRLSNLRYEKWHEMILTFEILGLRMSSLATKQNKEPIYQSIQWEVNYINQFEEKKHLFIYGYSLESLRLHYLLALALGEKALNHSLHHLSKVKNIITILENSLPKILGGQVRLTELNLIGNMGEFVKAEDVLKVANDAHAIYSTYDEDALDKEHLTIGKAEVRWWIAEACSRLAAQPGADVKKLHSIANQHLNWIKDISSTNDEIRYIQFKSNQVQSRFLTTEGKLEEALKLLRTALQEYSPDLFELIQVYARIVQLEHHYLSMLRDSIPTAKRQKDMYGEVMALKQFIQNAKRQFDSNSATPMLHNASISAVGTLANMVFETSLRDDAHVVQETLDLWIYSIYGFIDWGMAGQALLELLQMKTYAMTLPTEFEVLVKNAIHKWDPRHELLDRRKVEQAIQKLIGGQKIELSAQDLEQDKKAAISQAYVLMAYPNPNYEEILQLIEALLSKVNLNEPDEEDVNLYTLLVESCSKLKKIDEATSAQHTLTKLRDILACKVYLEVAKVFSESAEISESYLSRALSISFRTPNKYSNEAAQMLTKFGQNIKTADDITKSEAYKVGYQRSISISIEEYDQTECYNLLFVFENELRQLILLQFNQQNGWWKKGIPQDIYNRVSKENEAKAKGMELLRLLTLGDLFKVILSNENWEPLFKRVFQSRQYVESRSAIILPLRNKIAHNNPLTRDEISEFVSIVKHMLSSIRPFVG